MQASMAARQAAAAAAAARLEWVEQRRSEMEAIGDRVEADLATHVQVQHASGLITNGGLPVGTLHADYGHIDGIRDAPPPLPPSETPDKLEPCLNSAMHSSSSWNWNVPIPGAGRPPQLGSSSTQGETEPRQTVARQQAGHEYALADMWDDAHSRVRMTTRKDRIG